MAHPYDDDADGYRECGHDFDCERRRECGACERCEHHCERSPLPHVPCMNADGLARCEGCDERRPLVLATMLGGTGPVEYFCARCTYEIADECNAAPTIVTPIDEQARWSTAWLLDPRWATEWPASA